MNLTAVDPAKGINIPARVQTKEMLGSEIIYSLATKYGTLMCKSENDIPDNANITASAVFDAMYLFGADTMRIPFTDEDRKAAASCFGEKTA